MIIWYILLLAVLFGCNDDYCENFVTYEERFPIYNVEGGEYTFLSYIVIEDVMVTCECLLYANERAKAYRLRLEAMDVDSMEFEFHMNYPSYYSCK